ncbi:MAG: ribosome biogenesis GTPase Der [Chthoniobacteraceae bacterium]|nr:ribosome biogenesis GTPase Der [Chthoniobacteraceae bacterium]
MRTVAIVGRPNVGKSALFNRLAGRRISIVHDQPGVTRDRIAVECRPEDGEPFTLLDTGGIGSDVDVKFTQQVENEVALAMETADVILFVVDAQAGLNPVDQTLAKRLRRIDKPLVLVVNKVDHAKHAELDADFARLGFPEGVSISAEHNRGIGELSARIQALLPPLPQEETEPAPADETPIELAIVGRPNVGKSSLINAILEDSRTMVSNISGTTRDAVDVPYRRGERRYTLIDTAGIRPAGKQDSSVEIFSVMRSERTIRRADLCVLVVDATAGVTAQDKRIAGLIQEAGKPCLVAVNKWDLIKDEAGFGARKEQLEALLERIRVELFFVDYAPIIVLSALKGEGMTRLFKLIEQIRAQSRLRISTGALNRLLAEALTAHPPPARNNKRFKIVYATQPERNDPHRSPIPTPSILLFVNQADLLVASYRKFLDAQIRQEVAWTGLPLKFYFKEREARGRRAHVE